MININYILPITVFFINDKIYNQVVKGVDVLRKDSITKKIFYILYFF